MESHDESQLPIEFNKSLDPNELPNVTLGNHSLMASHREHFNAHSPAPVSKYNGAGRRSPSKTIKEYNQQVSDLTKENFNLKLRIYHLEERMGQQYGDEQDVFKTNIALKVTVDQLQEELQEKQNYLNKAGELVNMMTSNHQQAEEAIKKQCDADKQKDVDTLKEALNRAAEECEVSRKQAEQAARDLVKVENSLRLAQQQNEELSEKYGSAQSEIDSLINKQKDIGGLTEMVSGLEKQLERKDRDMQRLSVCFQDKSLVESMRFLEPQHLQDKYEDQVEELKKLTDKIIELEDDLASKDEKLEAMAKELQASVKDLDDKAVNVAKCHTTIKNLMMKIHKSNKSCEEKDAKIKGLQKEAAELKESLDEITKEKAQILSESTMMQENNDRLHHQLDEVRNMAEGMMQTLGKKQGEISGFQEQLQKAMEALTNSETAVEELQLQLKRERVEFESKLRNQAELFKLRDCNSLDSDEEVTTLKQQLDGLKKSLADHNVVILGQQREMADLENQNKKMKDKDKELMHERDNQDRKLLMLEREIQSLRLELERRDMRLGSLQQNAVNLDRSSHGGTQLDINVQVLSQSGMEDLRLLLDNLRQELLTVKVLQDALKNIHCDGTNTTPDALYCEIEAIRKLQQKLEEGLAKNGQLHQCLVNSMPVNGLTTSYHTKSLSPRTSGIGKDDQMDRPPRIDVLSPRNMSENREIGRESRSPGTMTTDKTLNVSDLQFLPNTSTTMPSQEPSHFSGSPQNATARGNLSVAGRAVSSVMATNMEANSLLDPSLINVSILDHSLTDDAKEGSLRHSDSLDYSFDPRMQDHTSLYRLDSQEDDGIRSNTGCCDSGRYSTTSPKGGQGVMVHPDGHSLIGEQIAPSLVELSQLEIPDQLNLSKTFNSSIFDVTGRKNEDEETESQDQRNSWVKELSQYRSSIDGQSLQTSPKKDGGNLNNSGRSSSLSTPLKEKVKRQHQDAINSLSTVELAELFLHLKYDLKETIREKEAAQSKVHSLKDKLEATENTVRQLSRKMKNSQSSEQSCIPPSLNGHSDSELSPTSTRWSPLHIGGGGNEEPDGDTVDGHSSMEKARDEPNWKMVSNGISHSLIVTSPAELAASLKQSALSTMTQSEGTGMYSPERMSQMDQFHSLMESERHSNYSSTTVSRPSKSASTTTVAPSSSTHSSSIHSSSNVSNSRQGLSRSPGQEFNLNQSVSFGNGNVHLDHQQCHGKDGDGDGSPSNSSVCNNSKARMPSDERNGEEDHDDPTLNSVLVTDYTYLHNHFSIMSESILRRPGDQSFNDGTLNVDKLQARLAHLERIILMQREEITVYESLLASMGVPLQLSTSQGTDGASGDGDSQESLLHQHLMEIRKLRQRLESLDLGNDPDQYLIFHSHTQQRITQQERTISHLQQNLIEKEESWKRETMETEHRLNREKGQLAQKLEIIQEELKTQRNIIEEQEKVIQKLNESLLLTDEGKREAEEENGKLKLEKAEIKNELLNREKEFLDMERNVFKLELAKEEVEAQKKTMELELEENERQMAKLKSDADLYKESCKNLKEVVKNKEEAMHEQVHSLRRMAKDKASTDEKLLQLEAELDEVKNDARKWKIEIEEKKSVEDELVRIREEYTQLKVIYEQKTNFQKQILNQKGDMEVEIARLKEEKIRLKSESQKKSEGLYARVEVSEKELARLEFELKSKEGLQEEVSEMKIMLDKRNNLESELRCQVSDLEGILKAEEEKRLIVEEELKEKIEKVKKRDRQCQFVLDRFGKLEAAYKKQKEVLRYKTDALNSMKKQLQISQNTLSIFSKDGSQGGTMKELLHELMLTKQQVAELLNRLEGSANQLASLPEVINLDAFDTGISSATTTITTETRKETETTSLQTTSVNRDITTTNTTNQLVTVSGAGVSNSYPSSPSKTFDIHTLYAVFKLEEHEKARKESGECLVSLSGLEARIEDRLNAYKAKDVTESLDYSTLREAGMACHQMRTYLSEVSRIISLAWITELPQVSGQGRFCDPSLVEETEQLKTELSRLQSRNNMLDQKLKDHQGKITDSKQRQKDWEHSVCRQLLRTSQDLEQAKENLDLSRGILQQVNTSTNTNTKNNKTSSTPTKTGGDLNKSRTSFSPLKDTD